MSEKGLKGDAEHPELLFVPSTILDVLQFSNHIEDNLSQMREKAEGSKEKKLRTQKRKLYQKVIH